MTEIFPFLARSYNNPTRLALFSRVQPPFLHPQISSKERLHYCPRGAMILLQKRTNVLVGGIAMKEWYIEKIMEILRKIKSPQALRHIYNFVQRAFDVER
jgi:hypothetical protein